MTIYMIVIFILIFYQILLIGAENKNYLTKYKQGIQLPKILYIPVSIFIFFIAALRVEIGYDFVAYKKLFNIIHESDYSIFELSNKYNYEIGYIWLNKILPSFQSVIFYMALIGVGIKLYYIYKYSDCRNLTLFMYFTGIFLTFDMGVIRQGVAIAMYFIVINFYEKNQKIEAIITIFISCLFHISSLIYFFILFFKIEKIDRKKIYLTTVIASIFIFFNLNNLFIKLFSILGIDILTTKVEYYSTFYTGDISISYFKRVFFLVIFTEFYKKYGFEKKIEKIMFSSYFLSVLFMAIFSSIDILGGRGVTAFYFTQCFIFASMYKRVKKRIIRIVIVGICVALSLFAMRDVIKYGDLSGQRYTPYTWIWS